MESLFIPLFASLIIYSSRNDLLIISCELQNTMPHYTQAADHARIETGPLLLRLGPRSMFIARATAAVIA